MGSTEAADSHGESKIDFGESTDAVKRLGFAMPSKVVEQAGEARILEEVLAENRDEIVRVEIRAENSKGKEALGTFAAPDPRVGFAADITALEDWVVFFMAREKFGDLEFVQRAKETKVFNGSFQIAIGIGVKVLFELEALGVLVVDLCNGWVIVRQGFRCHSRDSRPRPKA